MEETDPKTRGASPAQSDGGAAAKVVEAEPIFYEDGADWRIVDLRPHGVDCIPLLAFGNFASVRPGAAMHVHPGCVEASLCLRGNVRYETDDIPYPVMPGHVFVSRPNEPHRRCDNPKGMLLYRMLFSLPQKGGRILGLSSAESAAIAQSILKSPYRLFHATERLKTAFVRLFEVYDSVPTDETLHRLEMRCAALELLLAFVEAPEAPHSAKRRPNAKVKAVASRIDEHPELDYPVAALAAEAALSSFAFTEAFKRATGLTPHAYLIDRRVRKAKEELAKGRSSIAFVADKWRFSSPQHMAVAFKRVLGITPSQARQ